jgi:hypothetical protein
MTIPAEFEENDIFRRVQVNQLAGGIRQGEGAAAGQSRLLEWLLFANKHVDLVAGAGVDDVKQKALPDSLLVVAVRPVGTDADASA